MTRIVKFGKFNPLRMWVLFRMIGVV